MLVQRFAPVKAPVLRSQTQSKPVNTLEDDEQHDRAMITGLCTGSALLGGAALGGVSTLLKGAPNLGAALGGLFAGEMAGLVAGEALSNTLLRNPYAHPSAEKAIQNTVTGACMAAGLVAGGALNYLPGPLALVAGTAFTAAAAGGISYFLSSEGA